MPKRFRRAFNVKSGKRLKKVEADDQVTPSNGNDAPEEEDCEAPVEGSAIGRAQMVEVAGEESSGAATTGAAIGPNPLENPVVLNHLFRLCTPDVLATCRQVSKQWYNESLAIWRTTCTITFTVRNGSIFLTNRYLGLGSGLEAETLYVPLKKFLAYIETPSSQCSTKPYRNIKIVDCDLPFGPQQFEEFWAAMADNVTILELNNCTFSDVEDFRKIIFQTCPNLNRLTIDDCCFPPEKYLSEDAECAKLEYKAPLYGENKHLRTLEVVHFSPNPFPISWLEFFSHFQSVTSFVFNTENSRRRGLNQIDLLTDAIRLVRKLGNNKLPFKYFVLSPPLILSRERDDQRYLRIARELFLPVSALVIEIHPELDEDYLKDTLEVFAKTLITIQLSQEAPTPLSHSRQFPFEVQLNNLTNLGMDDTLFKNLTFLKYTPNLEALGIFVNDDKRQFGEYKYETPTSAVRNTSKEGMEHVRMERLEKLNLGCIVGDEDISSLFQWMPKIVNLKMILNDKQFGILCESRRDLKKLKVLGDKLTDEGVTGRRGRQRQAKQKGKTNTVTPGPNITYLQKLEKFSFMSPTLTADSVFHGFLGLPNLQKIKSCSTHMVWDKAARSALKKRKIELNDASDYYGYY